MNQKDALYSEAFARGRRDRLNGFSPAANPYPVESGESEQYRQGQLSAQDAINGAADFKPSRDPWESDQSNDTDWVRRGARR